MRFPLTLANQLTLLRLLLIPFFLVAVLGGHYGWAMGLLVAAGLTDFFDGLLARRLGQRTPLGAYLDPLSDKLLLSTSFVVLSIRHDLPWTLTILVLARDVLILVIALVILLETRVRRFPPSLYGKACTTAQIVTVFAAVLVEVVPEPVLFATRLLLVWVTGALTVVSGVHYAWRTARMPLEPPAGV